MSDRSAQWSNLDAMTWIAVDAFADDPVNRYRLPNIEDYPEEHKEFTRLSLQEYMDAADCEVRVFELPSNESPAVKKVVAFSIWQMPEKYIENRPKDKNVKPSPPRNLSKRPDGDPERMRIFMTTITEAKTDFFDTKYPKGHIHLVMLGCHPQYQRRGAGRALCQWALEKAKRNGLAVTVFATGEGEQLYEYLGFEQRGAFTLDVPGEDDLDVPAMYWEPAGFKPS